MKCALEKLQSLNLFNSSPEEVRILLKNLDIPIIKFKIREGIYILRARKGGYFTKKSEMTYCPKEKCLNFQRASLPGQPMFYGVISENQSEQEKARLIATSECSVLYHQGKNSIGKEIFTISHWEVIKPLRLISFITSTTFRNVTKNSLLNQLRELHQKYRNEFQSNQVDIADFISDEFSKRVAHNEPHQYIISATISSDIIRDNDIDGIIYPSVQMQGQCGVNVALLPKAVDEKLEFKRTMLQTLYKNGEKSVIRLEHCTENNILTDISQYSDNDIAIQIGVNNLNELPLK